LVPLPERGSYEDLLTCDYLSSDQGKNFVHSVTSVVKYDPYFQFPGQSLSSSSVALLYSGTVLSKRLFWNTQERERFKTKGLTESFLSTSELTELMRKFYQCIHPSK
jgi:hypothetical protein